MIPLGVVALLVIGIVGAKVASKSGLKRELAAARAKGLPTNPKELDAWYAAVPVAENAALKVVEAQGHLVEESEEIKEFRLSTLENDERLNQLLIVRLEEHLRKNEAALKLLHEAAELKRSRYPTDLSKAPNITFNHIFGIRRLIDVLRWEAMLRAERGDSVGAVKALRSGFAVAETMGQEPLLIAELIRISCLSILLNCTERMVSVAALREPELGEIAEAVRKMEENCGRALHRAFAGERGFANTGRRMSFDEYEQLGVAGGLMGNAGIGWMSEAPDVVRKFLYDLRGVLGIHDRDMTFYMRGLGRLIEASEHPDFFAQTKLVEADLIAELAKHPYVYLLSGISLPTMFRVPQKEVMLQGRLRCARVALEMERVRARTGNLLKVEELVPGVFAELPRDPVDGKPLEVRELAKGYEVVAVGTDTEVRKKLSPSGTAVAFKVVK
jgi:hypothetical protein